MTNTTTTQNITINVKMTGNLIPDSSSQPNLPNSKIPIVLQLQPDGAGYVNLSYNGKNYSPNETFYATTYANFLNIATFNFTLTLLNRAVNGFPATTRVLIAYGMINPVSYAGASYVVIYYKTSIYNIPITGASGVIKTNNAITTVSNTTTINTPIPLFTQWFDDIISYFKNLFSKV